MAIIGQQNYGTPFGAIKPEDFFDENGNAYYNYSGYSSRAGATGVTGSGGYTGFCGPHGLVFMPFTPALTFPLNYSVLQGIVRITWSAAAPADPCDNDITYELQFTRSLSRKNGWRTIASDIRNTFFLFDLTNIAYTEDGGLRVRARNSKGLHSDWSTTVEPFLIANHPPYAVVVVSPTISQNIDNDLVVSWIESSPPDADGHSVMYFVEFTSSFSSNSGWVSIPGGSNIPQGTSTFVADSFNLPDGIDYGVRIYAVDELGLAGPASAIGPLTVSHSGEFVIDTQPPTGSIVINDGTLLAYGVDVKLSLSANDVGTGIKDMRIGNSGDSCFGDWEPFSAEKFWKLPSSDGIKRVFVQFRDYAGNVSGQCDCEIVGTVVCGEGNVTSLKVYNNTLYIAFDQNGNVTSYKALVAQGLNLPENSITAMEATHDALYVATYDGTEAFLYSFTGKLTRMLSLADEKVTSMQSYGRDIYIAGESGKIYRYDGSIYTSYTSSVPIIRLRTEGNFLYAAIGIGGYFLRFDGIVWDTVTT